MQFFLGTHKANWLWRASVPLFVSHRSLRGRRSLHPASCSWALDSGGFTELSTHGRWLTSAAEYADAIERYREMGGLEFAAPRDWMCEPRIIERTGLSVAEHQERTVQAYLELAAIPEVIPVLQGWSLPEYLSCVELYRSAGVDLAARPLVGVGSVCRRQDTREAERIFRTLAGLGIRCHGFGVKLSGLARYSSALASADSMAWSLDARNEARASDGRPKLRRFPQHSHKSCSNCMIYALEWRARALAVLDQPQQEPLFA